MKTATLYGRRARVVALKNGRVKVESFTHAGRFWIVKPNAKGRLQCSCPAFIFHRRPQGCKHVRHVRRTVPARKAA